MCFESIKPLKAKIAKKDVKCWKTLERTFENKLLSVCEDFQYEIGIKQPKVDIFIKGSAFGMYWINEGYHSCKTLKEAKTWKDACPEHEIHKFIIPAGTRYFENELDYVSETIILVK